MSQNILDFYRNKTQNEQDELSQPYKKIIDSKMLRAKEISDKITLNKVQIVSSWKKIINDFKDNNDKEEFIKDITSFVHLYGNHVDIKYFLYEYICIQHLIANVEDKDIVKLYINKIESLIEYDHVFINEYQRSNLEHKFYKSNNLTLEELKNLKKIVTFEDFKGIISNDFNIDSDKLDQTFKKYTTSNDETIFQKNVKELYDSL